MDKSIRKKTLIEAAVIAGLIIIAAGYVFFGPGYGISKTAYIYVDSDDNADSVYTKIEKKADPHFMGVFKFMARTLKYPSHIRTGRYAIHPMSGTLRVLRNLRNGMQDPVELTIPSVRTMDKLAEAVAAKLMLSEDDLLERLTNEDSCRHYGYDTATVPCMFIPNTYQMYWDISPSKFLARMAKESKAFWTPTRMKKAEEAKLTPVQVCTLASIVDEESAYGPEKPMIAGMYINRFRAGMPLQADPTIKFAWKKFELKRIYNNLLYIKSPYNTYKNIGLPPGPIRIPSVEGIDAVLNYAHHDYLYMCAKEDFSGSHNFAHTYAEHLQNAKKYSEALNRHGIK